VSALALLCLPPLVHIFAVSLSDNDAVMFGKVSFWPVQFTLESYKLLVKGTPISYSLGLLIRIFLIFLLRMTDALIPKPARRHEYNFFVFVLLSVLGSGPFLQVLHTLKQANA